MKGEKMQLNVSDKPVSQQDKNRLKSKVEAIQRQANKESKVDSKVLQIQFNV